MTENHRFDAAIKALRFLADLTDAPIEVRDGQKVLRSIPQNRDLEVESFEAAIRILEAAAKFTADDIERISNTIDDFIEYTPISNYKCPGRVLKDKFIAFLKAISALPDEEEK